MIKVAEGQPGNRRVASRKRRGTIGENSSYRQPGTKGCRLYSLGRARDLNASGKQVMINYADSNSEGIMGRVSRDDKWGAAIRGRFVKCCNVKKRLDRDVFFRRRSVEKWRGGDSGQRLLLYRRFGLEERNP